MSATDTAPIPIPVVMIGGPHGLDSPAVHGPIPRYRWYAWLDLDVYRRERRRPPAAVIDWALGHPAGDRWPLWWLAPDLCDWLVHEAQVDEVTGGGQMLLARCLLSAPWTGPRDDVVGRHDRELTDAVPQCTVCRAAQ